MIHENQQKADDLVVSLAEILRYSLVRGQQEKISLDEELAIVQQYIEMAMFPLSVVEL